MAGLVHGFHESQDLAGFYFKQKPGNLLAAQKGAHASDGLVASAGLHRAVSA
jgi:hypothetical protein